VRKSLYSAGQRKVAEVFGAPYLSPLRAENPRCGGVDDDPYWDDQLRSAISDVLALGERIEARKARKVPTDAMRWTLRPSRIRNVVNFAGVQTRAQW
jgi:hypothetical protein